jgi:hypothetical protein
MVSTIPLPAALPALLTALLVEFDASLTPSAGARAFESSHEVLRGMSATPRASVLVNPKFDRLLDILDPFWVSHGKPGYVGLGAVPKKP